MQQSHDPQKFPNTAIVLGCNTRAPRASPKADFIRRHPIYRKKIRGSGQGTEVEGTPFLLEGHHHHRCSATHLSPVPPRGLTQTCQEEPARRCLRFAPGPPGLPLSSPSAQPRRHRQQDPRPQLSPRRPDEPLRRQRARGRLKTAATRVRPVTSGSCHTAETVRTGAAPFAAPRPGVRCRGAQPGTDAAGAGGPTVPPISRSGPPPAGEAAAPDPSPGQAAPHGLPEEAAPAPHRPPLTLRGGGGTRRLLSRGRGAPSPRSPPPVSAPPPPSHTHPAPAGRPPPVNGSPRAPRAPAPRRCPAWARVAVPRQRAARPERRPAQAAPVPDLLSAWLATQRRTTNLLSSQWHPPPAPDRTRPPANGRAVPRRPCPMAGRRAGNARPPERRLIPGRPWSGSQSERRLGVSIPPRGRWRG